MISPNSASPDTPAPIARWEWIALAAIVVVGAVLRFAEPGASYFNLHTARDLYRSLLLLRLEEIPLLGSEMQYGGRVLGPAMYVLCAPILAIYNSPVAIFYAIAAWNTALLAIVWTFTRRFFGPGVAIWSTALFAVYPLEIAHLRFLWNPCFLVLLLTIAYWGLLAWVRDRRGWGLPLMAAFLGIGMQFHFSAIHGVLTAVVLVVLCRPLPSRRSLAVAVAVLFVLFLPLMIHETTAPASNIVEVAEADFSQRSLAERWAFNRNGIYNYLYHVRVQIHEKNDTMGFGYLEILPVLGEQWLGATWMKFVNLANALAKLQLVFWTVGIAVAWNRVLLAWRGLPGSERRERLMGVAPWLWLLLIQFSPMFFLSFFNFHGEPGEPMNLVALRYYLVAYPATFITSAIGVVAMTQWLAARFPAARVVPGIVAGMLLVLYVFLDVSLLTVVKRSGRFVSYNPPNMAVNLDTMLRVREILMDEAQLDRDAYYTQVYGQQLGDIGFGEADFDWLVTQDPRSITNPPADPHLRWLMHKPTVIPGLLDSPEPVLPPGAEVLRRWQIDDKGFSITEFRVENPEEPLPIDRSRPLYQNPMRNFYFQDERMRYLGPDPELRARTP